MRCIAARIAASGPGWRRAVAGALGVLVFAASAHGPWANASVTPATTSASIVEPTVRLALVIGNASYAKANSAWSDLEGPRHDAEGVARRLQQLGFEVDILRDGDLRQMAEALRVFRDKLRARPGALAWFYFSGHGVQVTRSRGETENYLIPANTTLADADDAEFEALSLERVTSSLLSGDPLAAVVILDACRNNALKRGTKAGTKGLAPPAARENVLIAYAAGAGEVAQDGEGSFSPYTEALLDRLGRPGLFLSTTFKDVRRVVADATANRQLPEMVDRTEFEIVLTPAPPLMAGTPEGVLSVSTLPGSAQIYLDNTLIGTGRYDGPVPADTDLELRARAAGHQDAVERIRVARTKSLSVELALPAQSMIDPAALLGPLVNLPPGTDPTSGIAMPGFQFMAAELTVAQFRRFVEATGYRTDAERDLKSGGCWAHDSADGRWTWRAGLSWRNPGFIQADDHPVVCVSYNDLRHLAQWANDRTGRVFGAPSEAQWNYVALREGSALSPATACAAANIADRTAGPGGARWRQALDCEDGYFHTAPVTRFAATASGIHDLHGNVREWTADCWLPVYEPVSAGAATDGQCGKRVLRGGDFQFGAPSLDPSARWDAGVHFRSAFLGVRLAEVIAVDAPAPRPSAPPPLSREASVAALTQAAPACTACAVTLQVHGLRDGRVGLGEPLFFEFRSSVPAERHVLAVHVASNGDVTIVDRVAVPSRGTQRTERFEASEPTGVDTIFLFTGPSSFDLPTYLLPGNTLRDADALARLLERIERQPARAERIQASYVVTAAPHEGGTEVKP